MRRADLALLAVALLAVAGASLYGLRRGLPCRYSYHQDAVAPLRALGYLQTYPFRNAHLVDKYPAGAYLYFGLAAKWALDLRGDAQAHELKQLALYSGPDAWDKQIDPALWSGFEPYTAALSDMIVAGRIASALANVLLALGAALLAGRLFGARAAPVAAVLVGLHPYNVYYAHTMNVDAPCLAFAMWALYGVTGLLQRGTLRWALLAGAAAALAASVKDQIMACLAFVPVAMLVLLARWRRRGAPAPLGPKGCAVAVLAFFATYALAANWVFDPGSWVRHAQFGLSEEVRRQYDMVKDLPPWKGLQYMLIYVGTYAVRSAGVAGAVLALAGIGYGLLRRRAAAWLLLVPALGYLLAFVLRMGLAYPRHLLPVFLPALLLSAGLIAAWLRHSGWRRAAGWVLLALVLAVAWRGITVNRLWAEDPRARAAEWLARELPPGTPVLAKTNHATPPPQIPAACPQRWTSARDFQEALAEMDPRVIVAVESTQLHLVVVPRHPDLDEIRSRAPLPILAEFPRRVYHPILEDIDAAPVVVVFARPQ